MDHLGPYRALLRSVVANKWNALILERASTLGLSDWWLTAGCIAQSVWNANAGRAPEQGILDYDIFYFDSDTSWEAEDGVIRKTAALFEDIPVEVQIRNQGRVPLWYHEKFKTHFPAVVCAADGIDRFPCRTASIGVRASEAGFLVHAPYGLQNVLSGRLSPNTLLCVPEVYGSKTRRWMAEWPDLTLIPWPAEKETDMWRAAQTEPDMFVTDLTI